MRALFLIPRNPPPRLKMPKKWWAIHLLVHVIFSCEWLSLVLILCCDYFLSLGLPNSLVLLISVWLRIPLNVPPLMNYLGWAVLLKTVFISLHLLFLLFPSLLSLSLFFSIHLSMISLSVKCVYKWRIRLIVWSVRRC